MGGIDYVIAHTGMWINIWVLLAILAFVGVIIYFIVRRRKLIKMEEELEDLLQEKYDREALEDEGDDSNTNEDSSEESE